MYRFNRFNRMNRINRKGSLFVEASIVFPMFLLAVISICTLIRVVGTEENTMRCFAEEGQKTAKELFLTQLDLLPEGYIKEGEVHIDLLEFRTFRRIEKEESLKVKDLQLNRYRQIFNGARDDASVFCSLSYGIEIPLPLMFQRELQFEQRLLFRGFVGADNEGEGLGFDTMETPEGLSTVYVFPRAGEKFHQIDCRIIENYPKLMVLSADLKRKYNPCKLCGAGDLPWGSRVYCFDRSGKVYHKGSCTIVDKYIIGIDRDEAIEKGYTPCFYCGG